MIYDALVSQCLIVSFLHFLTDFFVRVKGSVSDQGRCPTSWDTIFSKLMLKPGISITTNIVTNRRESSPSPLILTGQNPEIHISKKMLTPRDAWCRCCKHISPISFISLNFTLWRCRMSLIPVPCLFFSFTSAGLHILSSMETTVIQ